MKVYTIGRDIECTIIFDDSMVSRRHALLKTYPFGKMELVALGQNGTFVNGVKLKNNVPFPVSRKDVVKITQNQVLDWKKIPDPLKSIKIGISCFIGVFFLFLIVYGGFHLYDSCSEKELLYEMNNNSINTHPQKLVENSLVRDTTIQVGVKSQHKIISFDEIDTTVKKKSKIASKKVSSKEVKEVKQPVHKNEVKVEIPMF